jgi:hypothetical protein
MQRVTNGNHKIIVRITGLRYSRVLNLWDGLLIQTQIRVNELYCLLALPDNVEPLVVILSEKCLFPKHLVLFCGSDWSANSTKNKRIEDIKLNSEEWDPIRYMCMSYCR